MQGAYDLGAAQPLIEQGLVQCHADGGHQKEGAVQADQQSLCHQRRILIQNLPGLPEGIEPAEEIGNCGGSDT